MVIAMELVFLIEIPAVCEDGRFFCCGDESPVFRGKTDE
jgi:hypothetical protein